MSATPATPAAPAPPAAVIEADEPAIIPQDMHPPVDLAEDFERFKAAVSGYLKAEDIALIEAAYQFAEAAHRGQFRFSGDPYLSHPLAVATTLAEWRLDTQALIAALLHDVIEDAAINKEEIAARFGKVAAELVDGVSKLDKIEHQSFEDAQAENFSKMLLAMARDVRVILVKLADRLHNMRTLSVRRPEKRRLVAKETLEIYAPLANRLGFNTLYRELQELAFRHLYPLRHAALGKALKAARGNRREVVGKILEAIRVRLIEAGIDADIVGREKNLYSIYRKMREKRLSFAQVFDLYGFRVKVRDVPSCYLVLGALHGLYQPVPGKFKDYIAIPKANRYQSLHTTLIGPYGTPLEIQIRTDEMNHVAESGVASHWLYKDPHALSELQQTTHKWLQSLLDLQAASHDSTEFLEHVKVDLFPDEVYVFTPGGKILELPRGATPVDFAYAIHTDIGNRCFACRVNFESMPLRTALRNGDRVEIITAPHAAPSAHWLSYVRTGKARAQIRHYLKTHHAAQSTALGERLLAHALSRMGVDLRQVAAHAWDGFLRACGVKSREAVLTDIGLGKRLPAIVARRLAEDLEGGAGQGQAPGLAGRSQTLLINGNEGDSVLLAKCCRPIPGDPIVGVIRKGQGLVVHTHDCRALSRLRRETREWVDADWAPGITRNFEAGIRVVVDNKPGVLAKIAAVIADNGINIVNIGMEDDAGATTALSFNLQVGNRLHLARIMRSLRRIPELVRILRVRGQESGRAR